MLKQPSESRILGITFSVDRIPAIMRGDQTETRRLMKPQPPSEAAVKELSGSGYHLFQHNGDSGATVAGPVWAVRKLMDGREPYWNPRYRPGDVCYVMEPWRAFDCFDSKRPAELADKHSLAPIHFEADGKDIHIKTWGRYRHARFMPRRFARTWVEVVDVRPEQVQEITEEDALLEGLRLLAGGVWAGRSDNGLVTPWPTAVEAFSDIWNRLHPDNQWQSNPWVWRYQFRLTEPGGGDD